jgi:hypothetical protein
VPDAYIDAIRPHISDQVEALIDLQLLTGARPGELIIMRGGDLDTGGNVWTYIPERHKGEHHGHTRTIFIGPKAQGIIGRFLRADLSAYLFSPKDAEADRHAEADGHRREGQKPGPTRTARKLGDRYTVASYNRRAIAVPLLSSDEGVHASGLDEGCGGAGACAAMRILVDYDNVDRSHRNRGPTFVVEKIIESLGGDRLVGSPHVYVRMYGGWYERQQPTRLCQRLAAQLLRDFPRVVPVESLTGTSVVRVRAELAYALAADPTYHLFRTFRPRGFPPRLSVAASDYLQCNCASCFADTLRNFINNDSCPVTVIPSEVPAGVQNALPEEAQ